MITGAWNLAILTPRGIAQRLFQLAANVAVDVQVAIDEPAPLRVMHSGITVVPASGQLIVAPQAATRDGLHRAATVAIQALEQLPETPVTAAGVNIRYSFESAPNQLIEILASSVDDPVTDAGFKISSRTLNRALQWHGGLLNLEVHLNDDSTAGVGLNFHLATSNGKSLGDWLRKVPEMVDAANELLIRTIGVRIENDA